MLPKKEILQLRFGEHIKRIRLKNNLTQVDVSSAMNKDQQSLQRVESGKVSPSLYYLFQLAEGLNVNIKDLVSFQLTKQINKSQ